MIPKLLPLLIQGAAPVVAPPDPITWGNVGNMSLATAAVGAAIFIAKAWRDSTRESAAAAALAAKETAERTAAQNKECNERNAKTVETVDSICDRFGDTQVETTKMWTDALAKIREDAIRQQEATHALVREHREANERREERLHEALKEATSKAG